jgi:hypothetical protein
MPIYAELSTGTRVELTPGCAANILDAVKAGQFTQEYIHLNDGRGSLVLRSEIVALHNTGPYAPSDRVTLERSDPLPGGTDLPAGEVKP